MIFNEKQCCVLTCRDISKISENANLKAENKMLGLMSSSVSHEMITPIKCIIQMISSFQKKLDDQLLILDLELVLNTAQMLLN